MNPSVYPITIANWRYIRRCLPELSKGFFTITLNKDERDFSWKNDKDEALLNMLRGVGFLTYASLFENVPRTDSPEEINLGDVYLGQTVKVNRGSYKFTGMWGGREGDYGQLGIYAGYGDSFPHLAYFLSMSMASPQILFFASGNPPFKDGPIQLEDALEIDAGTRSHFFRKIQANVVKNPQLRRVYESGLDIARKLEGQS